MLPLMMNLKTIAAAGDGDNPDDHCVPSHLRTYVPFQMPWPFPHPEVD
jgi:hypothetical protein